MNKKTYLWSLSAVMAMTALMAVNGCNSEEVALSTPGAAQTGRPILPRVSPTASVSPSASPLANEVQVIIEPGAVGKGAAAYGTNPLVVPVGTRVTWVNQDSIPHTATAVNGSFDSRALTTGQSYSFTFSSPGSYPYYCAIHGAASMSGVIEVRESAPGAAASPTVTPTGEVSPGVSPMPGGY